VAHPLDANTVALWAMGQAVYSATAPDSASGALGLTLNGGVARAGGPGVADGAYAFNGSDAYLSHAADSALKAVLAAGDFAIEAWVFLAKESVARSQVVFTYGGTDNTQPNNAQVTLNINAARTVGVNWENQGGIDVGTDSVAALSEGAWHHIGVNVAASGGNRVVSVQIDNGALVTSGSAAAPDGGTSSIIAIGALPKLIGFGDARWFYGSIGSIRISNRLRTSDEFTASYTLSRGDVTTPVVSNVSPAVGAISRTQAWSCRVTDDVAFRRILIRVRLIDSDGTVRADELAYDGSEFSALYSAGSTKTTVTAGTSFDFSLSRRYGWLYAPKFDVYAIDTGGNEGT
jgi:hypothetical protein